MSWSWRPFGGWLFIRGLAGSKKFVANFAGEDVEPAGGPFPQIDSNPTILLASWEGGLAGQVVE